ncbi:MAG: sugar transferase [Flavobacteriaceae bacterium]|nr:sugar transferase [Flavobacteriaceae bacterium]
MNNSLYVKYGKRIFDFIFSFFILVFVLSWLIPLIAIIVYIDSNEFVFYYQERVGAKGKVFKIIKFRSMKGVPPTNDPLLSNEERNRITGLGKIIRKYRIDEFPQFFNVLKGEMSIVGPRPERQQFLTQIIQYLPKYNELQELKPGITSLGQIRFGYADSLDEMLKRARYDLKYLNNLNFWTDIKVIFATIWVVLNGKGK